MVSTYGRAPQVVIMGQKQIQIDSGFVRANDVTVPRRLVACYTKTGIPIRISTQLHTSTYLPVYMLVLTTVASITVSFH